MKLNQSLVTFYHFRALSLNLKSSRHSQLNAAPQPVERSAFVMEFSNNSGRTMVDDQNLISVIFELNSSINAAVSERKDTRSNQCVEIAM